jgi:hypothetical protein
VTNIKFKIPSIGYNDVVGTVIIRLHIGSSLPYACVCSVTNGDWNGNPNPETHTVANFCLQLKAQMVVLDFSAGWSLYVYMRS